MASTAFRRLVLESGGNAPVAAILAAGLASVPGVGFRDTPSCRRIAPREVVCQIKTKKQQAQAFKYLENHGEAQLGRKKKAFARIKSRNLTDANEQRIQPPRDDYKGLRLSFPPREKEVEAFFKYLMRHPTRPAMEEWLHPYFVNKLLNHFHECLQRSVPEALIELNLESASHKLVLVGDLHGQLDDFLWILFKYGLPSQTNQVMYIFNGDVADRGENAVEIYAFIFALKLLHPDRVHLMRGNHEDDTVNRSSTCGGFTDEVNGKFGAAGKRIYEQFQKVFNSLPLAAVVENRIFLAHAGIPCDKHSTLKSIRSVNFRRPVPFSHEADADDDILMRDLLWSDPSTKPGLTASSRGEDLLSFGPDISEKFLRRTGLELIIRSHEVPDDLEGYEIGHDGRVVTIFSASNYCGCMGNRGTVGVLSKGSSEAPRQLDPLPRRSSRKLERVEPSSSSSSGAAMASSPRQISQIDLKREGDKPAISLAFHSYTCPRSEDLLDLEEDSKVASQKVRTALDFGRGHATSRLQNQLKAQLFSLLCDKRTEIGEYITLHWKEGGNLIPLSLWRKACAHVVPGLNASIITLVENEIGGPFEDKVDYLELLKRLSARHDGVLGDSQWKERLLVRVLDGILGSDVNIHQLETFFDRNDDGFVQFEEVFASLQSLDLGLSKTEIKELVHMCLPHGDEVPIRDFFTDIHNILAQHRQLSRFVESPQWVKAVLDVVRGHFSRKKLISLRTLFDLIDTDRSGLLELDEVVKALQDDPSLVDEIRRVTLTHSHEVPGDDDELIEAFAKHLDKTGTGQINYFEFLDSFAESNFPTGAALHLEDLVTGSAVSVLYDNRDVLQRSFEHYDGNCSGKLTPRNFRLAMDTFNLALADPEPPLSEVLLESLEQAVGTEELDYKAFLKAFKVGN